MSAMKRGQSMSAMKRVQRHATHLAPEETRSVEDYVSDVVALATKKVLLTERHGGMLVAEVLKAHGVDFIFCLSGGHISPFIVASKEAGIRIIDVRHEVNTVFAADAVGRLTGKPGVAAVTAGPGVTNTITAIKNCQMAQSPMVLLGGAAATVMKGRGALQDIDQIGVIGPIVKWSYVCSSARDIVPALRRAFQEAASGVPGPVFVELPLDVLYNVMEVFPMGGVMDRARARDVSGNPEMMSRLVVPDDAGCGAEQYLAAKAPDAPVFLELARDKPAPPWPLKMGVQLLTAQIHAGVWDDYDAGKVGACMSTACKELSSSILSSTLLSSSPPNRLT
jgi:hypothetical protein